MGWQEDYKSKLISAEEAAKLVKSGDVVGFPIWYPPDDIAFALARRSHELRNVTVQALWTRKYPWMERGIEEAFIVHDVFCSRGVTRQGVQEKWIDWAPYYAGLSSTARRHAEEPMRGTVTGLHADVFFYKITPPNKHGYCSWGRSVWCTPSAVRTAKIAVAVVDKYDPEVIWSYGDLGADTERFVPPFVELIQRGNVTGRAKNMDRGKHVAAVVVIYPGDPRNPEVLGFVDQNPTFELREVSHVLDPTRIAKNDNQVAINNGLAIDMLGQLVVDHLGTTPITGVGGHVEYTIGSHYAKGGRSITALMSTAKGGTVSRIVPQLVQGAVVQVPCGYVDFLVTEWGIVNLEAKTRRQRAEAIISVAHPKFRPELQAAARKLFYP